MHKYYVSDNKLATPSTLLLSLESEKNQSRPFLFQPGQYAAISFKHRGRPTAARCFSIVSSPTETGKLQFSMRAKGHYTKTLATLKVGEEVIVRGPFGGFVLDTTRDHDVVLLAGGIGITPFMSMIRYAASIHSKTALNLIYSNQSQDDVPFANELIELERLNPNFKVIFVLSNQPADKLTGQKIAFGRITPEVIDHVALGTYQQKTFFICGPPPFMKGMTKILRDKGASESRIITEAFGQGKNRQTGKIRSWPLNIYALSAIGVVIGSFTVMVSDLLKTLPASSILDANSTTRASSLTNSRQTDLDALVNSLVATTNAAPATAAVIKAEQDANAVASTPTTTTPAPTTTTPTPAPKPTPAPRCTTTQSGVTTCV